jgi:hypothetical protein
VFRLFVNVFVLRRENKRQEARILTNGATLFENRLLNETFFKQSTKHSLKNKTQHNTF